MGRILDGFAEHRGITEFLYFLLVNVDGDEYVFEVLLDQIDSFDGFFVLRFENRLLLLFLLDLVGQSLMRCKSRKGSHVAETPLTSPSRSRKPERVAAAALRRNTGRGQAGTRARGEWNAYDFHFAPLVVVGGALCLVHLDFFLLFLDFGLQVINLLVQVLDELAHYCVLLVQVDEHVQQLLALLVLGLVDIGHLLDLVESLLDLFLLLG